MSAHGTKELICKSPDGCDSPGTCVFGGRCAKEKRYYAVVISRELHVYASSTDEAIEMARGGEQYATSKVTAEIIDPPADEATPL